MAQKPEGATAPLGATAPAEDKKPETVTLSMDDFQNTMNRLNKLEAALEQAQASQKVTEQSTIGQSPTGQPTGITERFSLDPAHYEDPTEALYELEELRRLAPRENFELKWTVTPTRYQTVFGTWYIEPRFEITVYRKRYDDDGNELPSRIVLARGSFFEDPAANLLEADIAGVNFSEMTPSDFASAMRMFRYKTFILDVLVPKRLISTKAKTHEMVIGGRVYTIEDSQKPV